MASPLKGVLAGQIGPMYDMAVGYDDGTQILMRGYTIARDGQMRVRTVLQQEGSQIRNIASPNQVDSHDLTPWPKVSQGDWTGGERQVFFVDPTRYYSTDGNVDVSQPGQLQLLSPAVTLSVIFTGFSSPIAGPVAAAASSYDAIYIGGQNTSIGGVNMIQTGTIGAGQTFTGHTVGPDGRNAVKGILAPGDNSVFFAVESDGIYRGADPGSKLTGTVSPSGHMAILGGSLYYLNGVADTIHGFDLTAFTDKVVLTLPANEVCIGMFADGADRVYIATMEGGGTNPLPHGSSYVYSFDGANLTRIGKFPGQCVFGGDANGTTYMLASLTQNSAGFTGTINYTLYSISQGSISLIDDLRFALSDFQASGPNASGAPPGTLSSDGRFLYVSWAGAKYVRYDLASQSVAVSNLGFANQSSAIATSVLPSNYGLYQIWWSNSVNVTLRVSTPGNPAAQGSLVTSFFDFNAPGTIKIFRSIDFDLVSAIPANSGIDVAYRVDNTAAYTALVATTLPNGNLTYVIPPGVKGSRIQFRINPFTSSSPSPVIRSYSIKATLGRVWEVRFNCTRNPRTRGDEAALDPQGAKAVELVANLERVYDNTAPCVLFIPSPKAGAGGATPYVEQVNATLEKMEWNTPQGVAPTWREDPSDGGYDLDALIDCVFVESL